MRPIRLVVGYGVVAVLPYLALKVLWVSDTMVGVPEGSPAREPGFVAANIVTGLMDAVAILVALAFTHRRGRRLPAWSVLTPAWVGIGLLIPAVCQLLNGAAAAVLTGGRAVSLSGGLVAPWTYVVVYTSFGLQGSLLSTAFVLYARTRWTDLFDRTRRAAATPGPTRGVRVVLAGFGAVTGGAVAAAHLVMAFDVEGAFVGAYRPGREYTARSGEVVNAAMATIAVVGIRAMLRRPAGNRRMPLLVALPLAWTGTDAMFAYGLLSLMAVVAGAPEFNNVTALNGLTPLAALLGGLVIAVAAVVNLAERRHPTINSSAKDTP
jgi:hypothetical protein